MLCTACFFFIFKHWFCCKWQYNKYMFNFIDHLQFYSCKWLCRHVPQCTSLPRGPIMLLRRSCILVMQLCIEKCKIRWKRYLFGLSKQGAPKPQRVFCPHVPVDNFETNAIISIDLRLMSEEYRSVISRGIPMILKWKITK